MESEHAKASNKDVQKTPDQKHGDETPAEKNPFNSPPEVQNVESSSQESVSLPVTISALPYEETAAQKSSPEPTEMKSPPIQTMGRPPGYDPNRIPAAIFSTKPGNATDWSATSNESLFSIHMGNNSFSRDYAILFGKSGELPKLDDWNGSQMNQFMISAELPRLDDWNNSLSSSQPNPHHVSQGKPTESGNLSPVKEVSPHEESSPHSSRFSKVEKKDEDMSPTFVSGQTVENHVKENRVPPQALNVSAAKKPQYPETNSSSLSNPVSLTSPTRLSDASGHSGSSFAFPVLASHDSGKNDSVKVVPEIPKKTERGEQPPASTQAQASKEMPIGVSGTRWFSCFSCWPRFC